MSVDVGQAAPLFDGIDHDGLPFHLGSHIGNGWVLVWFWPNAPIKGGCGHNLADCGKVFRRNSHWLLNRGCRVVGVNYDTPLMNWVWGGAVDDLPFYLVSDPTREIAGLYGARRGDGEDWADLPRRMAFLIDPSGVVRRRWTIGGIEGAGGEAFVEDVFAALAELQPIHGVKAEPVIVPLTARRRLAGRLGRLRVRVARRLAT